MRTTSPQLTDLSIYPVMMGIVMDNGIGGFDVLNRGCEYSKDSTFTSGEIVKLYGDISRHYMVIPDKSLDTTYFYRAFAETEIGIGYGEPLRYKYEELLTY